MRRFGTAGYVMIRTEDLARYINVYVAARDYCANDDDGTKYDRLADSVGRVEAATGQVTLSLAGLES